MSKTTVMVSLAVLGMNMSIGEVHAQEGGSTRSEMIIKTLHMEDLGKGLKIANMGILFADSKGYQAGMGFHGLGVKLDGSSSIFGLIGEKVDGFGIQAILAGWYLKSFGKVNTFSEVNARIGVWGKSPNQWFLWNHAVYSLGENLDVGVASEQIWSMTGNHQEAAFGALVRTGPLQFFGGVDVAASLESKELFLRLMYKI